MPNTSDANPTTFTTTARMHEGYEIAEVDAFVTAVERSMNQRDEEINDLREQLESVHSAKGTDGEQPTGADRHESSVAAARLLELAANNADQLVAEATTESAALLAGAQAEADQLLAATRDETERVSAELAQQKSQQETELAQHRTSVLREVAERQSALEAKVARLQQIENDNRDRLRSYFSEQLDLVQDNDAPVVSLAIARD